MRGSSPLKVAFNLAQFALTATLSGDRAARAGAGAGRDRPGRVDARRSPPSAPARSSPRALVVAVIALAEGALPSREMLLMFGADLVVALTNTSVGLAGATLIAQDWPAGWLILPPAACSSSPTAPTCPSAPSTSRWSSSTASRARSAARRTSRPRWSTCCGARATSFRVRGAEIILFGAGGDLPLRTSLDADGATQTMEPVSPELATALRACLRDEQRDRGRRAPRAPPALAAYLRRARHRARPRSRRCRGRRGSSA